MHYYKYGAYEVFLVCNFRSMPHTSYLTQYTNMYRSKLACNFAFTPPSLPQTPSNYPSAKGLKKDDHDYGKTQVTSHRCSVIHTSVPSMT